MAELGRVGKAAIIVAHAIVGWALCGAIIAIGRQIFSMQTTLVIHAIGAPLLFALLSFFYFKKFGFTTPLQTAIVVLAIVIGLDLFVVAMVFEKSFAMFASVLGTWIPFALIFAATYVTGRIISKKQSSVNSYQ
jgi:hypothetical protein